MPVPAMATLLVREVRLLRWLNVDWKGSCFVFEEEEEAHCEDVLVDVDLRAAAEAEFIGRREDRARAC